MGGSIGADWSYVWLAINAGLGLAIGVWLTLKIAHPHVGTAVLTATAALGVSYLFRTDGGWWALLLFAGLAWLVSQARRPEA